MSDDPPASSTHHRPSRISGLSFDSPIPISVLFFCLVLLLFPSCYFSAKGPFSFFSQKKPTFFVRSKAFFLLLFCLFVCLFFVWLFAEQLGDDSW